jgi:YjbE family integral membrane protein
MWSELVASGAVSAFFQVIMIDLVLAGDNAVVIGMAAAGLPKEQRNKVIFIGIVAATVLRILLALITVQLLQVIGLLFAGGVLLLWVCWKLWREIRESAGNEDAANALDGDGGAIQPQKSFKQAVWQIIVADLSMSLDNVLAVGGAARDHPNVLIFGLVLSIALMGLAASFIARLLQTYRWIAYIGLVSILYVAFMMIWRGWLQMEPYTVGGANAVVSWTGSGPAAIGLGVFALLTLGVLSVIIMRWQRKRRTGKNAAGEQSDV